MHILNFFLSCFFYQIVDGNEFEFPVPVPAEKGTVVQLTVVSNETEIDIIEVILCVKGDTHCGFNYLS